MAYLILYPGKTRWEGPWRSIETLVNYFFIAFGAFQLVAGTYVRFLFSVISYVFDGLQVSIQSIIDSYHASAVGSVFSCASNAI
jgi:hypothetical protein